ncbi:MAG: hypothetical protein LBT01_06290 [Spirochaetaceae bacterium]|nr:hypothetical protein [Spirochaetaceae bacterium]
MKKQLLFWGMLIAFVGGLGLFTACTQAAGTDAAKEVVNGDTTGTGDSDRPTVDIIGEWEKDWEGTSGAGDFDTITIEFTKTRWTAYLSGDDDGVQFCSGPAYAMYEDGKLYLELDTGIGGLSLKTIFTAEFKVTLDAKKENATFANSQFVASFDTGHGKLNDIFKGVWEKL